MNEQFFYVRKEILQPKAGDAAGKEPETIERIDSFNMEKVIRTIELETGERLVLLNDIHDRKEEVPVYSNGKNPRQIASKNITRTVQSEIYLNENDSKRFVNLYNG